MDTLDAALLKLDAALLEFAAAAAKVSPVAAPDTPLAFADAFNPPKLAAWLAQAADRELEALAQTMADMRRAAPLNERVRFTSVRMAAAHTLTARHMRTAGFPATDIAVHTTLAHEHTQAVAG